MSARRCLHVLAVTIGALALAASAASANALVVSNTNDTGPGSLRDTIAAAATGDTVQVPPGTYTLAGQILVTKPLTIAGAGARSTVLDGGRVSRIFAISASAVPGMTISGVTLTHGTTGFGGAIDTDARLTLTDDAIVANTATTSGGGGIYTTAGLVMERDLVAGNSAPNGNGGGIELVTLTSATSAISDTTLVSNSAGGNGGGIDQSTPNGQTLLLSGDTLDGNGLTGATSVGGNLFSGAGSAVNTHASVFAGGVAPTAPDCSIVSFQSIGYNVEQTRNECLSTGAGLTDSVVADVQLGPLRDNGGPTDTLLPAAGSPLVDHGDPARCSDADQRGVPRPQGSTCDVGAVERTRGPSAGLPAVSAITATTATLQATAEADFVGGSASFAYGTASPAGASTPVQPLPGGLAAQPVGATLGGLTPGTTYRVQLHIHTAVGDADSSIASFTTTAPSGPAAARAPRISRARLTHTRFRVSSHPTAISAARRKQKRAPLGTRFRFTLSAAAKVQIAIAHKAAGLRKGRRCVAPSAKLQRVHAKRCTRTLTNGTLTRRLLAAGGRSVAFSGRIGRRALTPGTYTATIVASNAGGKAKAVKLTFTIAK